MTSCFWITGHFEKSALNDCKMMINTTSTVPMYMLLYSRWDPNFTPTCSTISHFQATGHCKRSALNDPKMNLSEVLHILSLASISPKYHSISLCDQPFSSYSPFCDNYYTVSHKCDTSLPESYLTVLLYNQPFFLLHVTLWQCTEWPQNKTLNTTTSKVLVPHIFYQCLGVPDFNHFVLQPAIFELHAILSQVHWMSLNTMRSKVAHIIYILC